MKMKLGLLTVEVGDRVTIKMINEDTYIMEVGMIETDAADNDELIIHSIGESMLALDKSEIATVEVNRA